jgi:hypothetical protein
MNDATSSAVWIRKAKNSGIDLSEKLRQDKKAIYENLDALGLPRQETLIFPAKELQKRKDEIRMFIKKHKRVFSRLNPLVENERRPYKLSISTLEELMGFVRDSRVDTDRYEIHILEEGFPKYGGVIVSGNRLVGELHKGKLPELTQGNVTPLTTIFDDNKRRFVFINDERYGKEEKEALLKAMKIVKNLKGYFQFIVSDKSRILFNNYQPEGEFARI